MLAIVYVYGSESVLVSSQSRPWPDYASNNPKQKIAHTTASYEPKHHIRSQSHSFLRRVVPSAYTVITLTLGMS